jgi:hypothetical protein
MARTEAKHPARKLAPRNMPARKCWRAWRKFDDGLTASMANSRLHSCFERSEDGTSSRQQKTHPTSVVHLL